MNDSAQKTLLILASKLGYQTRSFARAAEKLGVRVFFGTDRCHQLEDPWADGALALRFDKPSEAEAEIVRQFGANPPDAVLALGDRPTVAASIAAEKFGLSGNPPEAAEICRNKLRQRERLQSAGLRVPGFLAIPSGAPAEGWLSQVKFPCVVKPLTLAASQGVIRANSSGEFLAAVQRVRALLESPEIRMLHEPTDDLLVEEYIPGAEVALEGTLNCDVDGPHLRTLAIFDKPQPLEGPYFEETIYVTPSRLPETVQRAIGECAERAARAIGLRYGPVHAEFRIRDEEPVVLEIAPRPIGGLCAGALRFGAEAISLEELLIRDALRMTGRDWPRENCASGVMMIPIPRSGIFDGVSGIEDAEKVPGVTEIRITARLHDYVAAWPEGSSYLGFIFARADTPEAVESALNEAHALLHFRFSPRLPVEHPVTGQIVGER